MADTGSVVIVSPRPHTWALHGPKGMLVSINLDTGEHTFGENYTPDEAARVFWDTVGVKLNDRSACPR
jgi:hypothetical protein